MKGRLGLETARVPQVDRHGLLWLSRGLLYVESGSLRFRTAGSDGLPSGDYSISFQMLTAVLLGPGSTVSHDAMRLLARHGTGMVATGTDGARMYASMPFGPDASARARRQVRLWSDPDQRTLVARRMYAWRFGDVLPSEDLNVLRGIEGSRVRALYRRLAEQHGIKWRGRRYDRKNPLEADHANQAINHAATALRAGAMVAVAVSGAIPQLGFIHEDSGVSFALDVADLYRDSVAIPVAFAAAKAHGSGREPNLERSVRVRLGRELRKGKIIAAMIDKIKGLLDANDGGRDEQGG